jgi:hypothetical protein
MAPLDGKNAGTLLAALLGPALVSGCGNAGTTSYSLDVGGDDGGPPDLTLDGSAGAASAFDAHIEEKGITVSIVAVECSGGCVTVQAVATGGHPPYSFDWDDGSTSATRTICPRADAQYDVKVSDTATTGELGKPAQTLTVPLRADVIACADAGATDGGARGACDSVAASFVATGANPSGAWSYGYTASLGSAFVKYPAFFDGAVDAGAFAQVAQWMDPSVATAYSGPVPDVCFNPTSTAEQPPNGIGATWTVQPGQLVMWPGSPPTSEYSVTRWTAPRAGTFTVNATFEGVDDPVSTTEVHVQHDGADLPSGGGYINLNGDGNTFTVTASVTVTAGDTIDFAVGPGTGGVHAYDATALDAQVCAPIGDGG